MQQQGPSWRLRSRLCPSRSAVSATGTTDGELLDTAWLYHKHGGKIEADYWALLKGLVEVVADRWQEPDESFWEFRDARRQFVISKVMCWVAVQRAIRLTRELNLEADLDRWTRLRAEIRTRVEREGVNPRSGAFVQSLGWTAADATTLLIPLVHFLPASDPRVQATIQEVERQLAPGGLVYRYRREDGLPGDEGAFVVCSFGSSTTSP
jgi:GH15 family glucan-1,4-alpha-glucosidase